MSQLESLIAIIEQAKKGQSSLDAAQEYLLYNEGKLVKKVAPQVRRHRIHRLWRRGYTVKRLAAAFHITERHVRRILSEGPVFGHNLKDFVRDQRL